MEKSEEREREMMRFEKLCVAMFRRRSGLPELLWANHARGKGMLRQLLVRSTTASSSFSPSLFERKLLQGKLLVSPDTDYSTCAENIYHHSNAELPFIARATNSAGSG